MSDVVGSDAERRCARGDRCLRTERVGESLLGGLLTTPSGLCAACHRRTGTIVHDLARDVVSLTAVIAAQHLPEANSPVRASPSYAAPIRLAVDSLRADVVYEMSYWAIALGLDADRLRYTRLGLRMQRCAEWLSPAAARRQPSRYMSRNGYAGR